MESIQNMVWNEREFDKSPFLRLELFHLMLNVITGETEG